MLDAAIITWSDAKTTFNATTRRPASYLAERFNVLEQLWLQVGESRAGTQFLEQRGDADRSPQTLAKYASVSLLGLWGRREQYRYTMVTSSYDGDARPGPHTTISVTPETPRENGSLIFRDFVTQQKVLCLTSLRPIHQRCLEAERLRSLALTCSSAGGVNRNTY